MDDLDNYTGYRFLRDVKSDRQYAMEFVNGKPAAPLQTFGAPLRPNEVVFAVDDEFDTHGIKDKIDTVLYRIKADETAFRFDVQATSVRYTLAFGYDQKNHIREAVLEINHPIDLEGWAPRSLALPLRHADQARLAVKVKNDEKLLIEKKKQVAKLEADIAALREEIAEITTSRPQQPKPRQAHKPAGPQ